ncbi:MAG: hypothetical protein K0Q72_1480 [Armatimonadetes bacterium]|jgi:hypothetical protein|nr:hypothetical protein [Armatimonadota bacterium]
MATRRECIQMAAFFPGNLGWRQSNAAGEIHAR